MSKEPKTLLKADLILNYYKDDITERYTRNLANNIVMDNDILYVTNEKVYITTLEKHCELQQRIDKAIKYIEEMYNDEYISYGDKAELLLILKCDESKLDELLTKSNEILNGGENNR